MPNQPEPPLEFSQHQRNANGGKNKWPLKRRKEEWIRENKHKAKSMIEEQISNVLEVKIGDDSSYKLQG